MTEIQAASPIPTLSDQPDVEALVTEESAALVKKGIAEIVKGKISLSDLFQVFRGDGGLVAPDKKPPVPKALTEAQKDALERLPEVYGKVVVTADRALTKSEVKALVEERQVIDTLLAPLKARKEDSIREVLANHLDHLVPEEEQESARKDSRGHFAIKHEVAVEGTGKKVQRSVSGGKPTLSIAHIEALHAEGKIDRPTYLAITKMPETPRVLDESGLHKAIQKNPALFFLLGSVAEPTLPITTIKVVNDS